MGSGRTAVAAEGVTKIFQGQGHDAVTALDDVTVAIGENEFFTLLGPSGCGKTTLLRLIAGFDFPTEGAIRLYGEDIAPLPPYRRPVNTVFQNYALFPHMTVAQNIAFGLEMLGKPRTEIASRVADMLRLVRMEELRDRRTSQISGGQQQRVALARALAPSPKVLLLDEPLSALDYKLRKDMQIELKRMQHETGITFVFVTHDQEEALTMSDRIAVMSGGKILQIGSPHDIYDRPSERFVANFIGETNFLDGRIVSVRKGAASISLSDGTLISAEVPEAFGRNDRVTVVVRPEHASIEAGSRRGMPGGRLEHIVYFGTDTHYHVRLPDGALFIVRRQNRMKAGPELQPGTKVSIVFEEGAARVLRD